MRRRLLLLLTASLPFLARCDESVRSEADANGDAGDAGDDGSGADTGGQPLLWSVNPAVTHLPELDHPVFGTRPVGGVRESGQDVSYIENEVLLQADDRAEAEAFAARYGGTILQTDEVPAPPESLGVELSDAERAPRLFVVRVDTSTIPTDSLGVDSAAIGITGEVEFSSSEMARLWALAAAERRAGTGIALNLVYEPDTTLLLESREGWAYSVGLGYSTDDAFDYTAFDRNDQWSHSNITRAWQLLFAQGWNDAISIAVLDGGFWLDAAGATISATPGVADFPAVPVQYDFWDDDWTAGGESPNLCTGGNPCPWHGNSSASVAAAEPDNGYGAAGSGGWVANPWMFRFGFESGGQWAALNTALAWGADVISMSYSGPCSSSCIVWEQPIFISYREEADARGAILVASAGNNAVVVNDDQTRLPCYFSLCVGALDDMTTNRISYSNWGDHVDIFAPTNIPASPHRDTFGSLDYHGGTSASAPLVAGVAAMMKALSPGLNTTQAEAILRDSARTDSTDVYVTRTLDAYAALLRTLDRRIHADDFEPNDTRETAVAGGSGPEILLSPSTDDDGNDFDWVRFTATDWSRVRVELDFMPPLSPMFVHFFSDDDSPYAWGHVMTTRPDGADWEIALVPPGDHLVLVTANAPQAYDEVIRIIPTPLEPDKFETNNTPGTAATPQGGTTHDVSIHTDSDVDYYRIVAPDVPVALGYRVRIVAATFPVTMTIEDATNPGVPLATETAVRDASVDLPPGEFIVKVETASRTTRYGFRPGIITRLPNLETQFELPEGFDYVDPSGPIEGWLIGERDVLVFPQSGPAAAIGAVSLRASGINGTLYDENGSELQAGTALIDALGERFPFPDVATDDLMVLLLERTAPMPTEAGALLPAIPYVVTFEVESAR